MGWEDRLDDLEAKPARTAAKWTVRGWMIVVLVLALALVTGAALWGLRVVTSDAKGQGDAVVIKNDARNRIRAQEGFEKLFEDVKTADRNLTTTAATLRAKPTGDLKLETELLGQKHYCAGLVAEYNAKARSFTQQDFRAADLPQKIDDKDETTDCEEKK